MLDVEKYVQDWFTRNPMNPLFALAEFCKTHKVESNVIGNQVTFKNIGQLDLGKLVNNLVFEIGTWNIVRNENVRSTESLEKQSKPVRVSKK